MDVNNFLLSNYNMNLQMKSGYYLTKAMEALEKEHQRAETLKTLRIQPIPTATVQWPTLRVGPRPSRPPADPFGPDLNSPGLRAGLATQLFLARQRSLAGSAFGTSTPRRTFDLMG